METILNSRVNLYAPDVYGVHVPQVTPVMDGQHKGQRTKAQTRMYKTSHRQVKIEQHESHYNLIFYIYTDSHVAG